MDVLSHMKKAESQKVLIDMTYIYTIKKYFIIITPDYKSKAFISERLI